MFGDMLKELRIEKNLSQDELGEILGVRKSSISNWETNKATPPYPMLESIAKYFDVSTDYLLGRDYDKIQRLKIALKEAGINDLEKAMQILEILKEDTDTEK